MVSLFGGAVELAAEQPSDCEASTKAAAMSPWQQLDLSDLILPKFLGLAFVQQARQEPSAQRCLDLTKWPIMLFLVQLGRTLSTISEISMPTSNSVQTRASNDKGYESSSSREELPC
jgi:hypothetical protein